MRILKKMAKPNFKEMTLQELKSYVLKNRQDQEAWDEFMSRPRPNAVTFPPLWEMNSEQLEQYKSFWEEKTGFKPKIEDWMLRNPSPDE